MARPQTADDTPTGHDSKEPNHMILWLDDGIGEPKKYIHLKKAFGSNTDPRTQTWTMLGDKDYEKLTRTDDATTVTFEGVAFLLQAFQEEAKCLDAFEANKDKHIFFITSGALGRHAVPKIIERYRNVFTDPITNKSYPSIYVFCHRIGRQFEWIEDYLDYVQLFNFDSELLERMTRDIAEYFIERSARLRQSNELDEALQRLNWAKKLWYQYDKMRQSFETDHPGPVNPSQRSKDIDKLIEDLENLIRQKKQKENAYYRQTYPDDTNQESDDEKCAESCS